MMAFPLVDAVALMRLPKSLLLSVLMVGLGLAGCLGGEDPGVANDPAGPQFSDETGAVRGLVTTEDQLPISGAQVAIIGVENAIAAATSESGQYVLANVPPGTHTLAVQKLGYESKAQKVDVMAGQETRLDVELAPVPIEEPWIESLPHTGYMETGVGFVRSATCTGCTTNDTSYFMFGGFPEDYEGAIFEARWETQDFLGFDLLSRDSECGEDGDSSCMWYRVRSQSPVHFYVERCAAYIGEPTFGRSPLPCTEDEIDQQTGTGEGDGHLETWYVGLLQEQTHALDPVCQTPIPGVINGYEQGCYGVGVAQDIRWETWVTIFHMELPSDAERFTAFPDA